MAYTELLQGLLNTLADVAAHNAANVQSLVKDNGNSLQSLTITVKE